MDRMLKAGKPRRNSNWGQRTEVGLDSGDEGKL